METDDTRNADQPYPERETDRSDPEAARRVADSNATPSPHGGGTAAGGAYDADQQTPPKQ